MTARDDGMDPDTYRDLLGSLSTAVTVATSRTQDDRLVGMTASSVTSVSIDPPLVLVCVGKDARLHDALDGGAGFALSILTNQQEQVSLRFASGLDDPFDGVAYSLDPEGIPFLNGALAHIRCAPWGAFEAGDHTVFFGLVLGGSASDGTPLVRYRSNYTTTERR